MSNRKPRSLKLGPTQSCNLKLTVAVIGRIHAEAKKANLYPSHVVEQRLRHSFRISPNEVPHEPAA